MPLKTPRRWKRFLLLIWCMLLTSFFISAQHLAQPPPENRASPEKPRETLTWWKDGSLLSMDRAIKVSSSTRDPDNRVLIIYVTENDMFPKQWLAAPIAAHATSLPRAQMKRSLDALYRAMSTYPDPSYLSDNIKRIYVLGSLSLYGIPVDATYSADSIYIVNKGGQEYTDEYLVLSFNRAFGNLTLQKNNRARYPDTADVVHFAPQKSDLEMPAADPLMKLVYKANESSPDYIYALENTGFTGVTLFRQFKNAPRDDAVRCQLRCREFRRPLPAALRETIKQHSFVYHREIVDVAPVWSHGGKQIAFQSTRDHDVAELYVMRADGSNLRRLTRTAYSISQTTGFSAAVWSPDDRQLAYVMHPGGSSRLFTVNADGTGRKELLVENTGMFLIGWLPDRRILILVERLDRSRSVYSILPDGTGLTRFTEGDNQVGEAFLAPDQNLIAIQAFDNLIIKDLKFQTLSQSINSSGRGVSWSPDSKQIAYQDHHSLTVRDLRSGATRSSSIDSNEAISEISWSPDGKQIAYVGARGLGMNSPSINELRVVNADGTGGRRLTAEGFGPVWSPDGKYIIFSRGQARMYLIRADGSGERYLSHGVWARWIP
jgi:Tol biopolymer transport system component